MGRTQIAGIASFLPDRVIENAPLIKKHGIPEESLPNWPFYGCNERRVAAPDLSSTDIGVEAAKRLFERTGTKPEEIDLVMCAAHTPDREGIGIAIDVSHRLGIKRAGILDVNSGCSSYLIGINTARAYIESGRAKKILFVTATNVAARFSEAFQDTPFSWSFGDGAAATLLVDGEDSLLGYSETHDGEVAGKMGMEHDPESNGLRVHFVAVEERNEIFMRAFQRVAAAVKDVVRQAGKTIDDVDLFVTVQPLRFIIDELRRRVNIHPPRAHDCFHKYGSAPGAVIPMTLADAVESGVLKPGAFVVLGAFNNAGETVTALSLRWTV